MNISITMDDVFILARAGQRALSLYRRSDRDTDYLVMVARMRAAMRGASPAEIQRNVAALASDEPRDCIGRVGVQS